MSRSALLVGRTMSDVLYNAASLAIMALTGLLVGWRIDTGVLPAVAGFSLLLLFAYAFSWIMAFVGLMVPSVEVINNATFMVTMPLTFVANTFVPAENLPPVLRTFALWNPVSRLPRRRGAVREHSPGYARSGHLAVAASGAVHPDLGGGHHRRVRPAGGAPLPHHPARLEARLRQHRGALFRSWSHRRPRAARRGRPAYGSRTDVDFATTNADTAAERHVTSRVDLVQVIYHIIIMSCRLPLCTPTSPPPYPASPTTNS